MSNEVTNSTPLVTRAQHTALAEAVPVVEHLANEARADEEAGRAPEGMGEEMQTLAYKLGGLVMLLELAGMVSDG